MCFPRDYTEPLSLGPPLYRTPGSKAEGLLGQVSRSPAQVLGPGYGRQIHRTHPARCPPLVPGTCAYHYTWPKGLCSYMKDPEVKKITLGYLGESYAVTGVLVVGERDRKMLCCWH